jgi:hypothetical protein
MKKIFLASVMVASFVSCSGANAASLAKPGTLRRAVQEYYAANEYVQAAVFIDACGDNEFDDSTASRKHLRYRSALRYDRIRSMLFKVYDRTTPTDSELEKVTNDFCTAATPR